MGFADRIAEFIYNLKKNNGMVYLSRDLVKVKFKEDFKGIPKGSIGVSDDYAGDYYFVWVLDSGYKVPKKILLEIDRMRCSGC